MAWIRACGGGSEKMPTTGDVVFASSATHTGTSSEKMVASSFNGAVFTDNGNGTYTAKKALNVTVYLYSAFTKDQCWGYVRFFVNGQLKLSTNGQYGNGNYGIALSKGDVFYFDMYEEKSSYSFSKKVSITMA